MRYFSSAACCVLFATFLNAAPPVTALAYSPDGKLLAAGTRGVVYVFDTKDGKLLGEFTGQTNRVTALAFNKNGLLAIASGDASKSGIIRIYKVKDADKRLVQPQREISAHKDLIYALHFHPDDKTLATGSYDRQVKLWDITSDKSDPKLTLTDHSDSVYSLAFSPNGKLLATGAADRAVKVWDTTTGKRLYTLSDATDWVYAVAWHPNGKQLAGAGVDKRIRLWDVDAEGGKLAASTFAHDAAVLKLQFNKDGSALYSVGEDKVVKEWDAAKLKETKTHPAEAESVLAMALHPADTQVSLGRFDGSAHILDTKTWKAIAQPMPPKPPAPVLHKATVDPVNRGGSVDILIKGKHLDTVTDAQVEGPDYGLLLFERNGLLGPPADHMRLELKFCKSAPVGTCKVTVTNPGGKSNELEFFIDRFPLVAKPANTDSARTAGIVKIPATIAGKLERTGNTDYFRFTAKAGEEIGVQVQSQLDAKTFDPHLVVTDNNGKVLEESANGLLGFVVPKDGTYAIGVCDKEFRGGANYAYRLHIGPIPIVTSVFPLGAQRGRETIVHLEGVNLGKDHGLSVKVTPPADAAVGSRVNLPLKDINGEKPLGNLSVVVAEFPSSIQMNDAPELRAPATADGLLSKPGEAQTIKFAAKKGERFIVEVHAARYGSPLDSHIEILDSSGKPLPRALLRSVAKTVTVLRDHDSNSPGIRIETWNDLTANDYLFGGSELLRIKTLPRNPDDDCQFVQVDGRRVGFMNTTPTSYAMGATLYKVELHPPGSTFPTNGLPTFALNYINDDGGPGYGKDSRIVFDPPSTGTYQVRIKDARGQGGSQYAYRLTVRPPKPDFSISVSPNSPNVWKGGGVPITVNAKRLDDFDGPIQLDFPGLPAPFSIPKTYIEAEQLSATVTLYADSGVSPPKEMPAIKVVGTAKIAGKDVQREASAGVPKLIEGGDIVTTVSATEATLKPGGETRLTVKIARQGDFKGRVPLDVRGLPHGVRVLNLGLNGILLQPEHSEREIVIYAEAWVKSLEMPFVVLARSERKGSEHAAKSVLLKVQTAPQK